MNFNWNKWNVSFATPASFQVLSSHIWLVAAILDMKIEHIHCCKKFYCMTPNPTWGQMGCTVNTLQMGKVISLWKVGTILLKRWTVKSDVLYDHTIKVEQGWWVNAKVRHDIQSWTVLVRTVELSPYTTSPYKSRLRNKWCQSLWEREKERKCACVLNHSVLSTLCDLMEGSLPGSSVHRIFQARIPEWVAISYSRGFSWPRDWTQISCMSRGILYH